MDLPWMTTKRDIGLAIKKFRNKAGLNQEKLGKKINPKPVSTNTISRIETGKYNYSIDLLFSIAEVLDCDIRDFCSDSKKRSKIIIIEGDIEEIEEKLKDMK